MGDGMEVKDKDLLVEVDGNGVTVETVDPLALLSVATAYLRLLVAVADDKETDLVLTGLHVLDKCVAVSTTAADPGTAWIAATTAYDYLEGAPAPHGVKGALEQVREAVRSLPNQLKAGVRVGNNWLPISEHPGAPDSTPWSRTTLWVRPLKIGGRSERVTLESGSERGTFSIKIDLEEARRLGAHLKKDVLAEIDIVRGDDGRIRDGALVSWLAPDVKPGQELEAWKKWIEGSVDMDAT